MRRLSRPLALLVLLGLAGCPYSYTANDAGDGAWVEQVVPALVGRKPINALESQVLVDIAQERGRHAVVDVLTSLPEFDHYWSAVLADAMKVQRSGILTQSNSCWNTYPMQGTNVGNADPVLAAGLSAQLSAVDAIPAVDTAEPDFSNADVLRSALAEDDLFAPFRAQLFSLGLSASTSLANRGPARDVFLAAYTNRTPLCLQCHTSTSSASSISSIPVDIDHALFPGDDPYLPADNVQFAFAENDVATGQPFAAMKDSCGRYPADAQVDNPSQGNGDHFAGYTPTNWSCTDWGNPGSDCESFDTLDLDAALVRGKGLLEEALLADTVGSVQAEAWGFAHPAVAGDEALALALALTVTEAVVKEVEGHGLTLPHGHPRVDEQRAYLQAHALQLVKHEWSLRTLLKGLVLTGTFNMRPPSQSPSPYPFPMFFTGWAADDTADDAYDNRNGQGDLVHRYSVPALFRSVHHALGWSAPRIYPATNWPGLELQRAMGRYESYEETGFDQLTYQSLLRWEVEVGTCHGPTAATDWIDLVMTELAQDGVDTDGDGVDDTFSYTLEDVIVALKDRLVQEPSVDDGFLDAEPVDDVLDEGGPGPDVGVDWEDPDEVAAWSDAEAARREERAARRRRARAVTAGWEAEIERLERATPPPAAPPEDGAWILRYDAYTARLADPTWTRIWSGARSGVDEEGAAVLLSDYRVSTRSWSLAPIYSEAGKLEAYFGDTVAGDPVSLDTDAMLVANLEDKLRGLCGTLLTSPQFVLGGMRRDQAAADPVPELLVCLGGQAAYCDETALCEAYNGWLVAHDHEPLSCS